MSLASKGFDAVCFNSETATYPLHLIEMFDRKFVVFAASVRYEQCTQTNLPVGMIELSSFHVLRMELPISGAKGDKDISVLLLSGKNVDGFRY